MCNVAFYSIAKLTLAAGELLKSRCVIEGKPPNIW